MLLHTVELLLLPPGLIALGLLTCVVLLVFRRYRIAGIAALALLIGYYVLSMGPVPNLIIGSLERRFPAASRIASGDVEAIVVLAGAASYGGPQAGAELGDAGWRRLWRGLEIYWQLDGKVPILFSGGGPVGDPAAPGPAALAAAIRWGVPTEQFWLENGSNNTMESGAEVKKLLDQRSAGRQRHRIVLVTSAWHMPRAIWVFQRVGIEALPVPCDFRSTASFGFESFMPTYEAFKTSSLGFRETLGLLAYRLRVRG